MRHTLYKLFLGKIFHRNVFYINAGSIKHEINPLFSFNLYDLQTVEETFFLCEVI